MKFLVFYLLLIAFMTLSCSPKAAPAGEPGVQSSSLDAIAKNNLGSDFKILYNSNKTYAAVYNERKMDDNEYPTLKIILYDTKKNSVVWGRKAYRGIISWESKSQLKVDYYDNNNKRNTVVYDTVKKEVTYVQ